jgi:hypothetical protein
MMEASMADRHYEAEDLGHEWAVFQRRADGEMMDLKVCGDTGERWAKQIADALNAHVHVQELETAADRYRYLREARRDDERGYLLEMAQGKMAPWQVDRWVDSARARERNTLAMKRDGDQA